MKMLRTKYRIFKKEVVDGSKKVVTTMYVVRKRFIFFWYIPIKEQYVTQAYKDLGCGFTELSKGVSLETVVGELEHVSLVAAAEYCDKRLLNNHAEVYLGNHIVKMYNRLSNKMVYVNFSKMEVSEIKGKYYYEFNEDLDKLKSIIDSRYLSTKVSKVKKIIVK